MVSSTVFERKTMKSSLKLMLALCLFGVISSVEVPCDEQPWAEVLYQTFVLRHNMVKTMVSIKEDYQNLENFDDFFKILKNLRFYINQLLFNQLCFAEPKDNLILKNLPEVLEEREMGDLVNLLISMGLSENYQKRSSVFITKLRESVQASINSDASSSSTYNLPRQDICSFISDYELEKKITITDVCSNSKSCSDTQYPFQHQQNNFDTDFTEVCTADDKCDIHKALPLMTGVMWFKLSDWIVQKMCPNKCPSAEACGNWLNSFDSLEYEIKVLMAFTSISPEYFEQSWQNFFTNAIERQAHSKLDVALSMIKDKRDVFYSTPMECSTLMFEEACQYADIYKEYNLLKKIQTHRENPGLVKDLRLQSNINHAKMIELQRNSLKHIKLLGTIKQLDSNLKASVEGLSSYLEGLAKFDEGIADADILFIQGELDKYEKNLTDIETKLNDDMVFAMSLMETMLAANLAEEIIYLAAKIAENANPLKVVFSGADVGDILEQSGKVADATSQLIKGAALIVSLNELTVDSLKIGKAFHGENTGNRAQIKSLDNVVKKIRAGEANHLGSDADDFIQEYAGYTPQTDRSLLAKNNALWSAFKDATCDLLNGEVGIGGSVPKSVAGGMLICERMEGTLAQFFTLREEIFDFQFQLVDAVKNVVRAHIAKRLAQNIEGKEDVLNANELMMGFFIIQNRLQSEASLYCDILEYKQLGEKVSACSPVNGLFNEENVEDLIAYNDDPRYDVLERDVSIPTRARFDGDTGYIDLRSLAKGNTVVFKLPLNNTWLQEHGWTLAGETSVPFVESIQPFFPRKEYKIGEEQELFTTRVTMTAIAGSSVKTSSPNTQAVYVLPPKHSSYVTVYEEGYSNCPNEIDNPYSLCGNLPKICDKFTRRGGQSLLPTILTTWSLRFTIQQGSKLIKWDFPTSATDLLIRARARLRFLPSKKKRNVEPAETPNAVFSEDGCCTDNRHRSSLYNRNCVNCPEKSNSRHGGLFCESYVEEKDKPMLEEIKTWEEWKEWQENKETEEQKDKTKANLKTRKNRKGKKRRKYKQHNNDIIN